MTKNMAFGIVKIDISFPIPPADACCPFFSLLCVIITENLRFQSKKINPIYRLK
jgi:hypothetical protein